MRPRIHRDEVPLEFTFPADEARSERMRQILERALHLSVLEPRRSFGAITVAACWDVTYARETTPTAQPPTE